MSKTKYKRRISIVLLFSLLLLPSCTRANVPEVKHNDSPLWAVELEGANPEFVEDYIYLWDLLENEYPFLAAAERITGKNAEEIKEKYYYMIPNCSKPEDFYKYIVGACLDNFGGVGHLSEIPNYFYEQRYIAYKGDWEYTTSHPHSQYNFSQLTTPEALSFYADSVENAEAALHEDTFTGSVNTVGGINNLKTANYPESSTGYIRVREMTLYSSKEYLNNSESEILQKFFMWLESEGYENCVIDIRGNSGGADSYWQSLLVAPNLPESTKWSSVSLIKGDVCAYYISVLAGLTIAKIGNLDKSALSMLDSGDIEGVGYYRVMQKELSPLFDKPLFTGRFWLLVDESVYSSSESFAMFCKETGFATIVGSSTDGDGGGMDPILFALPNTGICIRFSSEICLNPDGSCNEEFGTTPDYYIRPSEDALEKCLDLIASD